MKTAVVYYSLEGNIKYVAEKVAKAVGADITELAPVIAYPDKGFQKFLRGGKAAAMKETPELLPYNFNAEEYDKVILFSPVWAGTFTPPLRTFLRDNDLSNKAVAVVASSAGGNADKCIEQLKTASKSTNILATLSLVNPKSKPTKEKEAQIGKFIEELMK